MSSFISAKENNKLQKSPLFQVVGIYLELAEQICNKVCEITGKDGASSSDVAKTAKVSKKLAKRVLNCDPRDVYLKDYMKVFIALKMDMAIEWKYEEQVTNRLVPIEKNN